MAKARNPLVRAVMSLTGNSKPKTAPAKKQEMKGGLFGKAKEGIKNRENKINDALKKAGVK